MTTVAQPRLAHVDALRGVAASAVLGHHLLHNTVLEDTLRRILPMPVAWVLGHGATGVEAFFVLSGFVIVLSLAQLTLDRRDAGLFVLRRQLRLDPPYWAMLAATLALAAVEASAGLVVAERFGLREVVTNALYLPKLLGDPMVLGVAWTLCIEIQFYLTILVVLGAARAVSRVTAGAWPATAAVRQPLVPALLLVTGLASLLHATVGGGMGPDKGIFFAASWHLFALGALVGLATIGVTGWWPATLLGAAMLIGVALPAASLPVPGALVGVATAAVLVATHQRRRLATGLGAPRVLQYLGSRSYAIYLAHLPVLSVVMRAGYKVTGERPLAALGWMAAGAAASLGAAEVLHRGVEAPAVRLSALVKRVGPVPAFRRVGAVIARRFRPAL